MGCLENTDSVNNVADKAAHDKTGPSGICQNCQMASPGLVAGDKREASSDISPVCRNNMKKLRLWFLNIRHFLNMMRYWGEIPVPAGQASRNSFDLLQREFRTVEMQEPPLHQPSANRPRPHHTHIQLIQHNRKLRSLIAAGQTPSQQPVEGIKVEESEPLPQRSPSPPLPEDLLPQDCKTPRLPFQIRHSDPESDFYRRAVTELSYHSCRQLAYQSVATILAHAGFDSANESVLETLTDVAHEYFLKFTKMLRFNVDREAKLGQTPFSDVMEQTFHEMGIGSVLSLQKFWQQRIKDYHTYMLQVSKQLAKEYEKIVHPERVSEDTKPVKIKEEPVTDITFPINEELEGDLASGTNHYQSGC
ncbi:unnamed protein product [Ranitomeya imitator]|uniref:Bromodomain associated domain-containing protein n=1 Tax=Ranitomeya imitator TaxID=111125 RepID=A0ABN9MM55_9NEOB|nr:unnamed protein product [Ranitomeya imitator]